MIEYSRYNGIPTRLCMIVLAFYLLTISFPAGAEAPRKNIAAGGIDPLSSMERAIVSETRSLKELKNRFKQLGARRKAILAEINAYKARNSVHGNLLLFSDTSVTDLEKAFGANKQALSMLNEKREYFHEQRETVEALRQQTQRQVELFDSERAEVDSGPWTDAEKKALLGALRRMQGVISEKNAILNSLYELQTAMIQRLEEVRTSTSRISGRLDAQLTTKIKQELFGRRAILVRAFRPRGVASEFDAAKKRFARLFDADSWGDAGSKLREAGPVPVVSLVILGVIVGLLGVRLRGFCLEWETLSFFKNNRWRFFCLKLFRGSVFFIIIIPALFFYDLLQFPGARTPLIRNVSNLLLIFLFARWLIDFLKHWEPRGALLFWLSLKPRIRSLVRRLRGFAAVYFIIGRIVDYDSTVLFAGRLILEFALAAGCISFWRAFRQAREQTAGGVPAPLTSAESAGMFVSYLAVIGGVIIEFAGYSTLAEYWYVSWSKTFFVVFWAAFFFLVIREWRENYKKSVQTIESDMYPSVHPVHLLLIQIAWVLWAMSLLDGLVLAWSTNPEVFRTVYAAMSRPWAIGNINLSLVGLMYAFMILFFTYTITRIGRYVLVEKIFVKSDMEPGLKASIITISVYLLWGLGSVVALGVLGVGSTSLAVVFGALSIGIGFGLQTIFNNFISGVILLFERPIQVGDAVEIGGVLGEVKKINVRATVVQTLDNASMIIPNSEFISSQVINWSFKDNRLRREVSVGVAYGSDIELVRKTLLEIADQTPNVLKYPKPDVLFTDHGDSALIFVLRFWTMVAHLYTTSTDIRFSLDHRFREHGIEIAFPQRDIHIRTNSASP